MTIFLLQGFVQPRSGGLRSSQNSQKRPHPHVIHRWVYVGVKFIRENKQEWPHQQMMGGSAGQAQVYAHIMLRLSHLATFPLGQPLRRPHTRDFYVDI
jgi:hypothetical protein